MGMKIWSLTSREEHGWRAFLNNVIRWIFSLKGKKSEEDWKYGIISGSSQNFTRVMELIRDGRTLTVAQEVSRQPFTAEARLQSLPSSRVIFVGKIALRRAVLWGLLFLPVSIIPPTHHIYAFACNWSYSIYVIESVVKWTLKTRGRRGIEKNLVEKMEGKFHFSGLRSGENVIT